MGEMVPIVAGDYAGNAEVDFGVLWLGPSGDKFQGLRFSGLTKYEPRQLKQVIQFVEANKKKPFQIPGIIKIDTTPFELLGVELNDGKIVVLKYNTVQSKPMQCLLLFAKSAGILSQVTMSEEAVSNFKNKNTKGKGEHKPKVVCPHCHEKGQVWVRNVEHVASLSMNAAHVTNLSMNRAYCENCECTWEF